MSKPQDRIERALLSYLRYAVRKYQAKNTSRRLGLSISYISRLCRGQRRPGLKALANILATMDDEDAEKLFQVLRQCRKHDTTSKI